MPLSEFAIRAARPRETAYKFADGGGLHLFIQPSGSKLWRMKYRHMGKENVLSFGAYPLVTLSEARGKRDAAKKLLATGTDPVAQRREDRLAAERSARTTCLVFTGDHIACHCEAADGIVAAKLPPDSPIEQGEDVRILVSAKSCIAS